jgi:uncharacterized protein
MNIEANKAVVNQFCELLSAGQTQAIADLMTDDVNYWIVGRKEVVRSSGDHSKAGIKRILDLMRERMHEPLQFTAKSMIGEGDHVALEAESYGKLLNGRVYNNQYHIHFELRDGKIAAVREYLDTQHAHEIWFA